MCHLRPSSLLPTITLRDRYPERARNWRGCTANTFIRMIASKARQAEPSHLSVDVTAQSHWLSWVGAEAIAVSWHPLVRAGISPLPPCSSGQGHCLLSILCFSQVGCVCSKGTLSCAPAKMQGVAASLSVPSRACGSKLGSGQADM